MADDPLLAVYAYVERAYLRLQASDVLTHCMEQGAAAPMRNLVENLVLAGPQSLSALREILAEVSSRKTQLQEDQRQVFSKMKADLQQYQVNLPRLHTPYSLSRLTPVGFLGLLRGLGLEDDRQLLSCLHVMQGATDLIRSVAEHLDLLEEIEFYLHDWMWGLIYESAQEGWEQSGYQVGQPIWPL